MKSMKAYMPFLLLGLLTFMTGTLAAQSKAPLRFDGNLKLYGVCGVPEVYVEGTNQLNYHQDGMTVSVHFHSDASTPSASSDPAYQVSVEANFQFDRTGAGFYDVPYHAVWAGQGTAPNFAMDGNVRVFMNQTNDAPVGAWIWTIDRLSCQNQPAS